MGPRLALARSWLRGGLGTTAALVLLVALVGGATSGALAASRRGGSALERFLDFNRPPTLQVYGEAVDVDAVAALPEVAGAGEGAYGLMTVEGPGGGPFPPGVINPFIVTRSRGEAMMRPLVVDGRLPARPDADQVAIDEDAAGRLGAGVGDQLRLLPFRVEQMEELYEGGGDFPVPRGEELAVTVAAVVRHPFDLNPTKPEAAVDAVSLASADIYLPEAFWAAHGDDLAAFGGDGDGVELLLRGGADDVDAVEAAVRAMPGGDEVAIEQRNDSLDAIADARQTVRFESVAMLIFAGLVTLAGGTVVAQALARQVRADLARREVLAGIGLSPRDVVAASTLRVGVIGVAGAAGGLALGWATSAVTPIGFGRRAEIDPGLRLDATVLAGVALVLAVLVAAWGALVADRASRPVRRPAPGTARQLAAVAARLGAGVPVVTGLSQLAGRGGRAGARTPLRSSLGAVVLSLAGIVAVVVFGSSLDRFVDRPAEHGWTFDLIVGDSDDPSLSDGSGADRLAANPHVVGYGAVRLGFQEFVDLPGVGDVPIAGYERLAGSTDLRYTEGRAAREPDEVVLGAATAEAAGAGLGDEVTLAGPAASGRFRVVGTAVLHELLGSRFELDRGAIVAPGGLRRLFGRDARVEDVDYEGGTAMAHFLVDVAPGVDRADAIASLRRDFGPTIIPHVPPLDVASLETTRVLPTAFAALVAVLGAASLVHLLLVTSRRRQRDLAVLATLGADRRQVAAAVVTLGSAVALAAVVVGLPVGLVAGRSGWLLLADALGAPTRPVVPLGALAAVVAAAVLLAALAAWVPARRASSVRPGAALRAE